jgi:cupin fold WbuC family metalloprotein
MRAITIYEIDELIREANKTPRKRTLLRLHEHEEPVQRMVNAILPGSYVAPHKHEMPDKVELFTILKGRVAVMEFDDRGNVEVITLIEERGPARIVELPPRLYHTVVALEPSALLEIIEGPYVEATHKRFAPWAPLEDNPKASDYYLYLQSIIHNRLKV